MKYFRNIKPVLFTAILTCFCLCGYSQVGINTVAPHSSSVLHIDSKGDTSGSTHISDDIIIDNNGFVGLGTLNPQAKMDITGKLRLSDGSVTDLTDYILASDAAGNASWKNYLIALRYKTTEWKLENASWSAINASSNTFTLSGTPSLTTEVGATTTNSSLTVPKGRYLIFITADIIGRREYAEVSLMQSGVGTIIKAPYMEALSACATYIEFTNTATLYLNFKVYDVRSNPASHIKILDPFPFSYPNYITASLVLLGLDVGG